MQFQVPQFIEVEDKIFGPLTFRQFVYLAGGAGIAYMLWRAFPIYIGAPLAALLGGLGLALAFFQYNGQPFIVAVEHMFFYFVRSKLYLWSNEQAIDSKKKTAAVVAEKPVSPYVPHLSESRLHELSWSLDIKERISAGTANAEDRENAAELRDVVAPIHTAKDALVR